MESSRGRSVEARGYELAAEQNGIVTRRHLLAVGWSPSMMARRTSAGILRRISVGVYRVCSTRLTPRGRLQAAVLSAGPAACAGGFSALWLHGLHREPTTYDVVVPGTNKTVHPHGHGVRTTHTLQRHDSKVVGGVRTQSVERALLDIAPHCAQRSLAEYVAEAIRHGHASVARLKCRLDEYRQRWPRHTAALRRVVEDIDAQHHKRQTLLEDHLQPILDSIDTPHQLQYPVVTPGHKRYYLDAAFPDHKLAIEADGYLAHGSPAQLRNDSHRQNALTLMGWNVLRYPWNDIRDNPEAVGAQIRSQLASLTPAMKAA